MSTVKADRIYARGALVLGRTTAGVVDIPASGILSLKMTEGSSVTLGGGGALELRGIELLDDEAGGGQVEIEQFDAVLKAFRTAPGVVITVRHNATEDLLANAIPARSRIFTTSQNDFEVRQANVRGFYAYVEPLADFRFAMNDELAVSPANIGDWPSPAPTSVHGALDVLASETAGAVQKPIIVPKVLSALTTGDNAYLVYRGPAAKLIGISAVLDGSLTALSSVKVSTTINEVAVTNSDIDMGAPGGAGIVASSTPTANNDLADLSVIRIQTSSMLNMLPTSVAVTLLIGRA